MKAYVDVNDVMSVLPIKNTKARKILHTLRKKKVNGEVFEGSFRDEMLGNRVVVPTNVFLQYFPEAKSALNDLWKEQIKNSPGVRKGIE